MMIEFGCGLFVPQIWVTVLVQQAWESIPSNTGMWLWEGFDYSPYFSGMK